MANKSTIWETIMSGTKGDAPDTRIDELYKFVGEHQRRKWPKNWDLSNKGQPGEDLFKESMTRFADWVAAEPKPSGAATLQKLNRASIIRKLIEAYGTRCAGGFSCIDPAVFLLQVALHRVRRPRIIYQAESGLCGASAVMTAFAKTDPRAYATFARNLYFFGEGNFNRVGATGATVRPLTSGSGRFSTNPGFRWLQTMSLSSACETVSPLYFAELDECVTPVDEDVAGNCRVQQSLRFHLRAGIARS